MCEALETGKDLVHFVKKKKAGVNSAVSKGKSEMRYLRGRRGLDHAQPGCYVNDFAFYPNAKESEPADLYFEQITLAVLRIK